MKSPFRLGVGLAVLMLVGGLACADPAQPLDPYAGSKAPAAQANSPAAQAPAAGPGYEPPSEAPPPPPPAPAPEGAYNPYYCPPCNQPVMAEPQPWSGVRHFSLGVHGEVLGINQSVGTHNVVMGGAGFQLRLRTSGRFGFEAAQGFLHTSYLHGNYVRDSYPFTLSFLFYVFPNRDSRHWNFYGVAGFGAMPDTVQVVDSFNQKVSQDFLEWEGHVGAGVELRFKWIAVEAEGRFVGLTRDDSNGSILVAGAQGAPIPDHSHGGQGNLYVSFWF